MISNPTNQYSKDPKGHVSVPFDGTLIWIKNATQVVDNHALLPMRL